MSVCDIYHILNKMENILTLLNEQEVKLVKIKELEKNTTIFYEDELCENVCFIIDGQIKISSFLLNGKEVIYNLLEKNSFFGNNLIFSSSPFYKGNVICEKNSKVVFINKTNLIYLLQNNIEFLTCYLNYQADFSMKLNSKIKLLSFNKIIERLFYEFSINNNKIVYTSIIDLAKHLNVERESLSRLINQLNKDNVIKKEKNQITLISQK